MNPAFFHFAIPHPPLLNFSKLLENLVYPEGFQHLSNRRNELSLSLKALGKDDKKYSSEPTLKNLEAYLLDVCGLIHSLETKSVEFPVIIEFAWSSGLTRFNEKVYFLDSLKYELGMILMAISYLKLNGSAYQAQCTNTTNFESYKEINKQFCEAAGIIEYVREEIYPYFDSVLLEKKPLEFTSQSILKALSLLCMAQSGEASAIIAEEREMKNSLVSKLYMYAADTYQQAEQFFLQPLKQDDFPKSEAAFLNDYLIPYCSTKCKLTQSQAAYQSALEASSNESHGLAISYLTLALNKISEIKATLSTSSLTSSKVDASFGILFHQQINEIEDKVRQTNDKFNRENETMYFESINPVESLKLPNGTQLLQITPYVLPRGRDIDLTLKPRKGDLCLLS